MKIVFATGNRNKVTEAAEALGSSFEIVTPAELGFDGEIPETHETIPENAEEKARFIWDRFHLNCFADDTGLEVDCLGGAPGVHSARYATDGHDFCANIDKLLSEMAKHPDEPRTARFRCVVTLIWEGKEYYFNGEMPGRIALERSGSGGFGYDPVFIADGFPDHTLADMPAENKNSISHRGKSLREMAAWLKSR